MADVIRCSITGSMPSGEVWSVNPVFALTVGQVVTGLELSAAAATINTLTIPTTIRSSMSQGTTFTGVRLEARDFDGTLEAQAENVRATPIAGTSSVTLPFQAAAVLSLRALAGGASGRGRLYWPLTGMVLVSTTSRILPATVSALLSAFEEYLGFIEQAINASVDETVRLAVWSRTNQSASSVARLQMGDVMDTQRRRRDAVTESYTEIAYSAPV